MKKIVLVTGGFDPLHSGHIEYFKSAKTLGDHLVVGINSDEWLARKKGKPFMTFDERASIIKELSCVDEVIGFDDSDNSACSAIMQVLSTKSSQWKLIFANGGDRINKNTPEYKVYNNHPDVEFEFGVGGSNKLNSSSWILEEWKTPKTKRDWGWYRVLEDKPDAGYKIKELIIEPGKSLSDQRHNYRNEHWYVIEGECHLVTENNGYVKNVKIQKFNSYNIEQYVWHKASNYSAFPCHILEVQYGDKCIEEDIERRD